VGRDLGQKHPGALEFGREGGREGVFKRQERKERVQFVQGDAMRRTQFA
jgi:hypothetical protein